MNEDDRRQALGAAVVRDRTRIYRTVEKAKSAAQISRGAWEKVETGKPVRPYTLAAVEQALDWPAGRAQRIIDGVDGTDEADDVAQLRADLELLRQRLDQLQPPTGDKESGKRGA